ncbi:hypothetical protein NDU88_012391 [Pleurodeles waltl]|uniref:Uncharacterized protein n=1 Tax=Pleurodeles waltl TaxID=8319 RepID=A0AAV7R1T1_PLEWA|nr:hypothetical protein NDU88_012391 [Pleurodeles waltl]
MYHRAQTAGQGGWSRRYFAIRYIIANFWKVAVLREKVRRAWAVSDAPREAAPGALRVPGGGPWDGPGRASLLPAAARWALGQFVHLGIVSDCGGIMPPRHVLGPRTAHAWSTRLQWVLPVAST